MRRQSKISKPKAKVRNMLKASESQQRPVKVINDAENEEQIDDYLISDDTSNNEFRHSTTFLTENTFNWYLKVFYFNKLIKW